MHILFVEDDLKLQAQTAKFLEAYQHQVTTFDNTIEALTFAHDHPFDVLLCDQRLRNSPTGLTLAAQIRRLYPDRTIVMISSYATVSELSQGFELEVDAYLQRPIALPDLLQKIYDALARRQARSVPKANQIECGDLTIDIAARQATWHDEQLSLTPSEFKLLTHLASKPGELFSVTDLCALIKGAHMPSALARNMLKQHILGLRTKLSQGSRYEQPIENIRGHGYRLVTSESIRVSSDTRPSP